MKILSVLILSLLFSTFSFADQKAEQNIKQRVQELALLAPLAQTCILLLNHEMADTPLKEANCNRIVDDFNYLLNEMCRMQDNLHQEK